MSDCPLWEKESKKKKYKDDDSADSKKKKKSTKSSSSKSSNSSSHKKMTSDRAASREEAKLAQLEVDSMTPLHDGCDPEVTRLSFTLELLKTKAKNKWTDTTLDELLKYLKKVLPAGSLCPTSV